jgi:hypothetical protein
MHNAIHYHAISHIHNGYILLYVLRQSSPKHMLCYFAELKNDLRSPFARFALLLPLLLLLLALLFDTACLLPAEGLAFKLLQLLLLPLLLLSTGDAKKLRTSLVRSFVNGVAAAFTVLCCCFVLLLLLLLLVLFLLLLPLGAPLALPLLLLLLLCVLPLLLLLLPAVLLLLLLLDCCAVLAAVVAVGAK